MPDLSQRLQSALADRYRIERPLGRGGMATVYLAEDLKHHRRVAVKVLDPEVAAAIGPERFLREIETVARLTHPHILPLHDSGAADGLLYYVMPYVEGESLRDRLAREKQLPLDDALRIAREVADALSYAHCHGLVHRDVKPENILLESGHAVVADFGIARAVAAAGGATLTGTGTAVGTPAYMSPEQAAGNRDVDGRSDLYSLGCVLYEMLAGVPPFSGTTAESLTHQHLNVTPRPVTQLRPAVPAGVTAALQRALAKTPADRFTTIGEFAAVLGTGAASPAGSTVARNVPRVAWVAGGVLAAVAVLWVGMIVRRHAIQPATSTGWTASLAVLPLENLSADPTLDLFCDGMTEYLSTSLSGLPRLKVIDSRSTRKFKRSDRPLREIGQTLGATYLLRWALQKAGERVRVTAQLVRSHDGVQEWGAASTRPMADVFTLQDSISAEIASRVLGTLTSEEQGRLGRQPLSGEAVSLFARAQAVHDRYLTRNREEDWQAAASLYTRALALDPHYAPAYGAFAHLALEHIPDTSAVAVAQADSLASAALRLDPTEPLALVVKSQMATDPMKGYEVLKRAVAANPNNVEALLHMGYRLRNCGLIHESLPYFERVQSLNPLHRWGYAGRGAALSALGRAEDARRDYERALEIEPEDNVTLRFYFDLLVFTGRLDEAERVLTRIKSIALRDKLHPAPWAGLYDSDAVAPFEAMLSAAKGLPVDTLQPPTAKLAVYILMGRRDEAIAYLMARQRSAMADSTSSSYLALRHSPRFATLRSDPRFASLLEVGKRKYERLPRIYGIRRGMHWF